ARQLGFPFAMLSEQLTNLGSTTLFGSGRVDDLRLSAAGERAYNRWLADYCAGAPGRALGLMHVPSHDMTSALRELRWGKEAGLVGVQIPSDNPRVPPYWDEYWNDFWATCEDLQLPVHIHGGTSHGQDKGFP